MTPRCIERDALQDAVEIGIWENEGGAAGSASNGYHGRRTGGRSRSVHHVFAGVAADGQTAIGPNRPGAGESMTSIDLRGGWRRKQRIQLTPPELDASGTKSSW